MKNYMVHFRRGEFSMADQSIILQEQQRMAELMRENILQQVHMSKNMQNLWMLFRIESVDELKDVIRTLPMCKNLFFEIEELMN